MLVQQDTMDLQGKGICDILIAETYKSSLQGYCIEGISFTNSSII